MSLNSLAFVFLFLPAATLAFIGFGKSPARAIVCLLLASVTFYALSGLLSLGVLAVSISVNFWIGRALQTRPSRPLMIAGVLLNLGVLATFNVLFTTTLGDVIGFPAQIGLPLGISFFAHRQVLYLMDCHRGKAPAHSVSDFALFSAFFPTIVAGPITRIGEIVPQFANPPQRRLENISIGLTIFIIGLSKKLLLADNIAPAAALFDKGGAAPHFLLSWIAVVAYGLQIYFSFSGYADMATGAARMFGITLPANFASPYRARSITDFWRRWHITLSRSFREAIYDPLAGSHASAARQCAGLFAVTVLCGLWHGAAWTFLLWGLLHGLALTVHAMWLRFRPFRPPPLAAKAITLLVVLALWVPFRAPDLNTAVSVWSGMLGLNGIVLPTIAANLLGELVPGLANLKGGALGIDPLAVALWIPLGLGIALFAPNTQTLLRHYAPVLGSPTETTGIAANALAWRPGIALGIAAGLALILCVLKLNDAATFTF